MKLQQLRYFKAVCDQGSVSGAAAGMYVSQSTVSIALRELEEEFGVPLFLRNNKRLTLTHEGQTLLGLANQTLEDADAITRTMKGLAGRHRPLSLGITTMFAAIMLPEIYREVTSRLPDIQLQVSEGGRTELLERLSQRKLNIAVLPRSAAAPAEDYYYHVPLIETEYGYCVAPQHRLAGRDSVTIAEIGSDPLITFRDGYTQKLLTDKLFREQGLEPNIVHSSWQLSTIMEMVSSNNLGCIFFMELQKLRPDLCYLHLDPPVRVQAELVWRKDLSPTRDEALLLDCIRGYYAK